MTSRTLALSSPLLLAEYVRQSELRGFFEKRLAAPPDHAAILIRDGQVVDVYKGAHFSIGGVFQGLRSLVAGSTHVRILLADLKPFRVQTSFQALTRDRVDAVGVVTLELQVNPERAKNVLGLVNPIGCVGREEVLARFRPHLSDRVFEAVVGRVDANDLRGDRGLQDLLQGEVMRELERVAGDIGLLVRAVSVEWARNAVEREAMRRAELDRGQEQLDHELQLLKRNLERNGDAAEVEIKANVDLARLKIDSDDEIARLTLAREVDFLDARAGAERRQEMAALAHEIEVLATERAARFENELAEAGQQIDLTRQRRELTRVELEIDGLKQAHALEMKRLSATLDLELDDRRRASDLDHSGRAERQSREHIAGLQAIERDSDEHAAKLREASKDGDSRRAIDAVRADADARVAQLQAGANLTPEQILAIQAGLSPDVAQVLAEQARAKGSANEDVMSAMRDLVRQATDARVASEQQARDMFKMAMDGAVGVAQGAGGKPVTAGGGADAATTGVECASCGRENTAKAKFCIGCGHKLRT